jgi:hypothetical protein
MIDLTRNYPAQKDAETKQQMQIVENIINVQSQNFPTPPKPKDVSGALDFTSGKVRSS